MSSRSSSPTIYLYSQFHTLGGRTHSNIVMADAAVEFLLGNLKQLLVYNANLITSIKDQVESLCNDLRLLAAFVKETTESRNNHAVVKELVRQIRIEVYKAEDIVDMYVFHSSIHQTRNRFEKLRYIVDYPVELRRVGKDIEAIRRRVKDLNDNKLFANEGFRRTESFARSPPSVEEENVVGFDKETEQMVGWIKAETKELEVMSVEGMGGLGKTTLVKKVYNDPGIQFEFFIRSWVYVSQVYNRREVLRKILYDVTRENKDTSGWNDDALADELNEQLKDGRYLIVLDDVWSKKVWGDLKRVFPNTKNGSRILLTSRDTDVALNACTTPHPYKLKFLTDDESWELLEKKVFPKGTRCSTELEELGKQIAKKCYGLPLAIVVIAGILRKKDKTRHSWERIEEKVNTYVAMESEQCMDVLAWSYNHLPYDLKACFLYFGVFPEDFEIPVWKLIHIWVAEGFIQQIGDASPEEMAEKNLEDLVDRNLVLVEKRRANGGIKTCRIHDMLHELCVKQAEEENFFKDIKGSESFPSTSLVPIVNRRICVHSRISDYLSLKLDSSHVRSFLCYAKEEMVLPPDLITYFPGSFHLLRVLDVRPISFNRFPTIQLVHLRYIALLGTFKVLPAAISNLWNLQTLVVDTNSRNIDVQADLWKLLQLRHVYTSAASDLPTPSSKSRKSGKDPLVNENLRTMSLVSPNSCTDVILARTPNLQKLGIRGKLSLLLEEKKGSCKFDNITKLSHLETLKLLNDTYPTPPLDGKLLGLPEWYKFPPKLKKLTLSDTMLDWEHMSVLGKLPGLEVLKLGDYAFVGERWEMPDGSFTQLRVLQIGKTDLVHWEAVGHLFPVLQRLGLKHCEKLEAVPRGLGEIASLEVVELSWSSRSAAISARQMEKNFKLLVFPPDQETQS